MFTDISLAEDLNTKFSDFLKSSNVDVSLILVFILIHMHYYSRIQEKSMNYELLSFLIGWY